MTQPKAVDDRMFTLTEVHALVRSAHESGASEALNAAGDHGEHSQDEELLTRALEHANRTVSFLCKPSAISRAIAIAEEIRDTLASPKPVSFVRSVETLDGEYKTKIEWHTAIYEDGSVWQRRKFEWQQWDNPYECQWQRIDMVPSETLRGVA